MINFSEKEAKPYNVPVDPELAPTTHYANEARFLDENGRNVTGAHIESHVDPSHGLRRVLVMKYRPKKRYGVTCGYLGYED